MSVSRLCQTLPLTGSLPPTGCLKPHPVELYPAESQPLVVRMMKAKIWSTVGTPGRKSGGKQRSWCLLLLPSSDDSGQNEGCLTSCDLFMQKWHTFFFFFPHLWTRNRWLLTSHTCLGQGRKISLTAWGQAVAVWSVLGGHMTCSPLFSLLRHLTSDMRFLKNNVTESEHYSDGVTLPGFGTDTSLSSKSRKSYISPISHH